MLVTSPAQTVVDLACRATFADAVAAMDSALHRKRPDGPLTTKENLWSRVVATEGERGWRRAAAAAKFSTGLSDSVEESHSRVQIHLLGFPAPVLQLSFADHEGPIGETDFAWPEFEHVGEFDGASKYLEETFRNGRTVEQVVMQEKRRENRIRRQVRGFSRWDAKDLYPPTGLHRILSDAGLPSRAPRSILA